MLKESEQNIYLNEGKNAVKLSTTAVAEAFGATKATPWQISFPTDKSLWVQHFDSQGHSHTLFPYEFLMVLEVDGKKLLLHQILGDNVFSSDDLHIEDIKNLKILICSGKRCGAIISGLQNTIKILDDGQEPLKSITLQIYVNTDEGDFLFSYTPLVEKFARRIVALESNKKSVKAFIRHLIWAFILPQC